MRRRLILAATAALLVGFEPGSSDPGTSEPEPTGPLYGFWGLNGFWTTQGLMDVADRTGMGVYQVACADPRDAIGTMLPQARAAGIRMTLRMTGDHERYTRNGDFDVHAWKAQLAPWLGSGVQPYIDDGTLVGHMLLDDIHTFPGDPPTAAELEEMARYSKSVLPGLMTYVRERATQMPVPDGGTYAYVDANVNQYKALDGDVREWAVAESTQSRALGLGLIHGLNLPDGGDGRSGQPGWRPDRFAMSADEVREYGAVMADVDGVGMFLNWEYDNEEPWTDGSIGATYLRQPDMEAALRELGELVAQKPAVPLLKQGP